MIVKARWPTAVFAAAALAFITAPSVGDDVGHEMARRLVQEGRILTLAQIVDAVSDRYPGQVIEVELDEEDGIYVYELKLLGPNGRVQALEVEAATGKIIDVEDDD